MKRIKVHVADNHSLILEGIKSLTKTSDIDVVGYSKNGLELIEWCNSNICDVIVLDLSMKVMNGIEVLKYFKQNQNTHNIVVFSSYLDSLFIEETLKLGAKAYLIKDDKPENLVKAITNASIGKTYFSTKIKKHLINEHIQSKGESGNLNILTELLSKKELKIVKLLVNDHNTVEIGKEMNISPSTVRSVTLKLREKFNTPTTVGLALRFAFLHDD
ncbi:response regulator transcription factor [uncultured Tenacibaculum sp.]|uniref:response regulator transcription factor n=1 Tax=uncultured Tenacibaculum sp. TaxID=174713 RepID=UPI0026187007|nr:response regulator transcription factor [uncultured Tenacibaculum sp.]